MPAPNLVKTWQIQGDNLIPTDTTFYVERKKLLLGIINKLIGFASNPMTVIGSNNATASGMDAVNRWSTDADINTGSWIVLQDAQINAKFQIVFFCNANWNGSGTPQVTIVVSRLAGFGTANGGGDGSTSTRPTATDEDSQAAAVLGVNGASSKAYRYYVWRSSDGQSTRVIVRNATDSVYCTMWEWGKPRNPRTLWTDPCYYRFSGNVVLLGTPIGNTKDFTAYLGTTKVTTVQAHGALPGGVYQANLNQINDWEGALNYDTFRIYLNSKTLAGARGGIIGELFDVRACPATVANGVRMPSGGPYTWCMFADAANEGYLLPWDNVTTPKFTAAP